MGGGTKEGWRKKLKNRMDRNELRRLTEKFGATETGLEIQLEKTSIYNHTVQFCRTEKKV